MQQTAVDGDVLRSASGNRAVADPWRRSAKANHPLGVQIRAFEGSLLDSDRFRQEDVAHKMAPAAQRGKIGTLLRFF